MSKVDSNNINMWNNATDSYINEQEKSDFVEINKKIICDRFCKVSGKEILDLGCGYGYYTDLLREFGNNVIGCDGSEKMLEYAKERYTKYEFQLVDIEKELPYGDNTFDIILSNQVLMDIKNIESVVTECARVIKDGGILYIGIVHPAFYNSDWQVDYKGFCKGKIMDKYLSEYSKINNFWGDTMHYHRTISTYVNVITSRGFRLTKMNEPEVYDGVNKSKEIPLFLFIEFEKIKEEDLFYSESNMAHLRKVIEDIEKEKATLEEHDLIEE